MTNCEFIYEQSDKSNAGAGGGNVGSGGGFLTSLSKIFTRGGSQTGEITAMCSMKDVLVIGFSNGVLLLLDTDKLEIQFTHKHFTKNDKAIDKLKIYSTSDPGSTSMGNQDSVTMLFSLSDGLLSYHHFPKITLIDELVLENNIVDF